MKSLREILTEYCIKQGWDTTEDDLEDTLRECFPVVWEGDEDGHRWRIDYYCVCKIEDRFFYYSSCKGTNDNSWSDAGYEFEGIDNVVEVFPKPVMNIEYVTKDKL